ncbi:MAG TPA: hypothetical protein VKK31_10515 [Thermoanaerobaculia bacterium]|nr:hypothetical protein [Thermoanaerobaculia bacterium]
MNPENDTGVLVTYLKETIKESQRLREDLKHGHLERHAPAAPPEGDGGALISPDPPLPPE